MIRAIIVPSSARRTFWLGLGASAAASAVFLLSSFHPSWPIADRGEGWPMPSQVASFTLWLGVLVSVAVIASHVIYQLRREVRAARKIGEYVLGEKLGEGGMGRLPRHARAAATRDRAQAAAAEPGGPSPSAASSARWWRRAASAPGIRWPSTDYGRTADGTFYYAMSIWTASTSGS